MVLINKEKSHDNIMSVLNTGMNQMYLNEYRRLRKDCLRGSRAKSASIFKARWRPSSERRRRQPDFA